MYKIDFAVHETVNIFILGLIYLLRGFIENITHQFNYIVYYTTSSYFFQLYCQMQPLQTHSHIYFINLSTSCSLIRTFFKSNIATVAKVKFSIQPPKPYWILALKVCSIIRRRTYRTFVGLACRKKSINEKMLWLLLLLLQSFIFFMFDPSLRNIFSWWKNHYYHAPTRSRIQNFRKSSLSWLFLLCLKYG